MEKISLITGINGQDGSYLTELLLDKQYIVYGIIRRASIINTERINHLMDNPNLILKYGDVTDSNNIKNIIELIIKNYPKLSVLEIYKIIEIHCRKQCF